MHDIAHKLLMRIGAIDDQWCGVRSVGVGCGQVRCGDWCSTKRNCEALVGRQTVNLMKVSGSTDGQIDLCGHAEKFSQSNQRFFKPVRQCNLDADRLHANKRVSMCVRARTPRGFHMCIYVCAFARWIQL